MLTIIHWCLYIWMIEHSYLQLTLTISKQQVAPKMYRQMCSLLGARTIFMDRSAVHLSRTREPLPHPWLGEEAVKAFRPTSYPMPYLKPRLFLGKPRVYRHPKFSVIDFLKKTTAWGMDYEVCGTRQLPVSYLMADADHCCVHSAELRLYLRP